MKTLASRGSGCETGSVGSLPGLSPHYQHQGVSFYLGDVLEVLSQFPEASVHCCITSPPYWGLRDYGTAKWEGGAADCDHVYNHGTQGATGQRANRTFTAQSVYRDECGKCGAVRIDKQIGLEKTPAEYVAKMVDVFREVRRVLRDDGTLWLNLGDSYSNDTKWGGTSGGKNKHSAAGGYQGQRVRRGNDCDPKRGPAAPGQPMGIGPSGLKPKDLCGIPWRVAFALQADGWWLRSDIIWAKPAPMPESVTDRPTRSHEYLFLLANSERYYYDFEAIKEPSVAGHGSGNGYKRDSRLTYRDGDGPRGSDEPRRPAAKRQSESPSAHGNLPGRDDSGGACNGPGQETRNKRDVWTVNSDPFPGAHFATFPPALIKPCILAGCPAGGTVLDPFSGAGTTALVAKESGRKCIGIELSQDYLDISIGRLRQDVLTFGERSEQPDTQAESRVAKS